MKAKELNLFESFFRDFVQEFGGEALPEARRGKTADYFFRNECIVAELKTLSADKTGDINKKLTPKVLKWVRENGRIPSGAFEGGKHSVAFKDMPREIQICWLGLLKAAVEPLIRDANGQIRDTKRRMDLPSAKGVVLIANGSNPYHDHPDSFRRLIAEVLRKRTPTGDLRFPHINGAVYFSFNDVKSRDEGMYFWANLQMKRAPDEDTSPLAKFQTGLQQGWYRYIQTRTDLEIRQHSQP